MKSLRGLLFITALTMLLPSFCAAADWGVSFENKLGGAQYFETYKPLSLKSKTEALYYEGVVAAVYQRKQGVVGRIDFSMPVTPSDVETWKTADVTIQTSDLKSWGTKSNIELGYAIPSFEDRLVFAPMCRYGVNFTRFSRPNVNILNAGTVTSVVNEDCWVHHIDIGARFTNYISDKFTLKFMALCGIVVSNTVHTSEVKSINGIGGSIIETDMSLDYRFTESMRIGIGWFFGVQNLEGATSGAIVWPDNELYTYGGTASLTKEF